MIISFYSYKGGVGRTQLLSNLAAYFCFQKHKKILLIDWDLDAPGIHYYFGKKEFNHDGLIELFQSYVKQRTSFATFNPENLSISVENYIGNLVSVSEGKIDLMTGGNYAHNYNANVNSFNWLQFYNELDGKIFVEILKDKINQLNYDFVFVDSRTGVSDYSGICNIQMPKINVLLSIPNQQSVDGTLDIANSIVNSPYMQSGRRQAVILPILSRVDAGMETKIKEWQHSFIETFSTFIANTCQLAGFKSKEEYVGKTLIEYKRDVSFDETVLFNNNSETIIYQKTLEETFANIAELIEILKAKYPKLSERKSDIETTNKIKQLIINNLNLNITATRSLIEEWLILDFPDLSEEDRKTKLKNTLSAMTKKDKTIVNIGKSKAKPLYQLNK